MIRLQADDELLDIDAADIFTAINMARVVRPRAIVVSGTTDSPHELRDDADLNLYDGDTVAHWAHPGLTGVIIETVVTRGAPRFHWVQWPGSPEPAPVAYFSYSLIRVISLLPATAPAPPAPSALPVTFDVTITFEPYPQPKRWRDLSGAQHYADGDDVATCTCGATSRVMSGGSSAQLWADNHLHFQHGIDRGHHAPAPSATRKKG